MGSTGRRLIQFVFEAVGAAQNLTPMVRRVTFCAQGEVAVQLRGERA